MKRARDTIDRATIVIAVVVLVPSLVVTAFVLACFEAILRGHSDPLLFAAWRMLKAHSLDEYLFWLGIPAAICLPFALYQAHWLTRAWDAQRRAMDDMRSGS